MQYNPEELKEILNIYKAESEEIIQSLNDLFMEFEKNPKDKTPLKKLLQLTHSLKGASRMLGFNSIQDLSHKLEDVLSYWKRDDITINAEAFQLIYKVFDTLSKSVEKSVELQNDYHDENILVLINRLSEFISFENKGLRENNSHENAHDYITKKIMDIKAIILELLFVTEKDDIMENFEDSILVITENLKQLSDIFSQTEYNNIKEKISSILNYLAENNNYDLKIIKDKITNLNKDIYNIFKLL